MHAGGETKLLHIHVLSDLNGLSFSCRLNYPQLGSVVTALIMTCKNLTSVNMQGNINFPEKVAKHQCTTWFIRFVHNLRFIILRYV